MTCLFTPCPSREEQRLGRALPGLWGQVLRPTLRAVDVRRLQLFLQEERPQEHQLRLYLWVALPLSPEQGRFSRRGELCHRQDPQELVPGLSTSQVSPAQYECPGSAERAGPEEAGRQDEETEE